MRVKAFVSLKISIDFEINDQTKIIKSGDFVAVIGEDNKKRVFRENCGLILAQEACPSYEITLF